MNAPTLNRYTAAQLARAAGLSKRAALTALKSTPPAHTIIVQGNEASAWTLESLPESLRQKITTHAHGLTVHNFISTAPETWQPPVSLEQITDAAIDKAAKLRRALARVISLRDNLNVSAAQLEGIGLEDYRREFGHAITSRTLRALHKRIVDRDRGFENWQRLEIYLDGNPPRKGNLSTTAQAFMDAPQFAELHNLMAAFKSAVAPSTREREALWIETLTLFRGQVLNGSDEKRARVALINFLWKAAPWLSVSKNALRVAFAGKYARWEEKEFAPGALRDGREAKRGIPVKPAVPQAVIDNVVAAATFAAGGRVSQAVRKVSEMADQLGLEPGAADLLSPVSGNKSFVNRRVREAVRHQVKMLAPYVIGARALDTARASLDRDYSNNPSGYCYSCDDVTLPVYWIVPDGKGWFNLVRGQCLITIDARTLCILGFSLQPDRNYSSPVIHTNFTRVFSDWGVPRLLYLERGLWKNSKLITGGAKAKTNHPDYDFMPFSWAETERGFGDLGVKFIHAIRARSKVVERVIGLVQDQMEGEPGYCGRDERRDCPAQTRAQMEDVKYHRAEPSKNFYSFDQWEARLVDIFARYNATVQQGKMLAGMSPAEAQEKLQSADEEKRPLLFDHTCRHLLAHYRVVKAAGKDGVTITIGKNQWTYRSRELSQHKFKKLLCWFDPDEPSCLAVTDMNMKNPFTVSASNSVNALDPDAENLATELARIADYESYGKARYQVLKANFAPKFRRLVPSRVTVETGQAIRQQREAIQAGRQQAANRRTKVLRRAAELDLPGRIVSTSPEADEGTAMMLAAKRNQSRAAAETPTPKTP